MPASHRVESLAPQAGVAQHVAAAVHGNRVYFFALSDFVQDPEIISSECICFPAQLV